MKNIAIVGGGVGGLAVAYNIMKQCGSQEPKPTVTVYEASDRFGGNGDTAYFKLGTVPDTNPPEAYIRWADLGVNDFNASTYCNIVQVMNEIRYKEGQNYDLLEDSTSYSTLDGSIVYATGQTVVDSGPTDIPPKLQLAIKAFFTYAPIDATNPKYAKYTIKEYITTVLVEKPDYDPMLGPLIIYPRVNGMYFVDPVDSTSLPFTAVMEYYRLQEGVVAYGKTARRMYFKHGAASWIEALVKHMECKLQVKFIKNFRVGLSFCNEKWTLENVSTKDTSTADVVVVATHADDALKMIRSGASVDVLTCLGQIKYEDSLSVAHTFAGVLPRDANAWKTYNILIYEEDTDLKPYTITYVCNRHQNDGKNKDYKCLYGAPQFFVTVNPPVPIPHQHVLVDTHNTPAVANLRHNVLDFACLEAQHRICYLQGGENHDLYFAGGWTRGAGLHEECWVQGMHIAHRILHDNGLDDQYYDASRGPEMYEPAYLRNLRSSDK